MKILPLLALCAAALLPAAAAYATEEDVFGHNFVRTYVLGRPYAADISAEVLAADSATLVSTVYYDGLGREVLAVQRAFGGGGADVASLTQYDRAGMVARRWARCRWRGSTVAMPRRRRWKRLPQGFSAIM